MPGDTGGCGLRAALQSGSIIVKHLEQLAAAIAPASGHRLLMW
jgi:hypothetical protein